jgi:methylglutaconyl-CoA hydratase
MSRTATYSEAENLRDANATSLMFRAIDDLPVPLIGRIHGAAIGGGAGLAAVCDIAIADEDTVFGFTEVKLGILPAVISPFVLAKIGRSAARELFLTGARFPAARAYKIGLVHAAVPSAELDDTVARYVAEIATSGREAVAAAKKLVREVWGKTVEEAAPITASTLAARRASAEGQEGLRAFLDKRKPRWTS